jgi:hypothetical protein
MLTSRPFRQIYSTYLRKTLLFVIILQKFVIFTHVIEPLYFDYFTADCINTRTPIYIDGWMNGQVTISNQQKIDLKNVFGSSTIISQ